MEPLTHQLSCPACCQRIYFSFSDKYENQAESICTKCHYRYYLERAEVVDFISRVEVLPSNKNTIKYRCVHQIRLNDTNQKEKSFEFSALGQEEKLSAITGDKLLLLYTIYKTQKTPTWIQNQTIAQSYLIRNPKAKSYLTGIATGCTMFVGSLVLATVLHLPINKLFLAAIMPTSISVGVVAAKPKNKKVEDRSELLRLSSEQELLRQKFDLESKLAGLDQELEDNIRLVVRLKSLQEKMSSTEEQLYSNRIAIVANGITVLKKHIALIRNLFMGYKKLVNMLTIEYETSRLAEQIPGDITVKILSQLEELKEIEDQKLKMSLLINPQQLLSLK